MNRLEQWSWEFVHDTVQSEEHMIIEWVHDSKPEQEMAHSADELQFNVA